VKEEPTTSSPPGSKMMGSEKFCLQWKEFQENVRHSYKEVRRTGEFSDVTLACEDGQQIRAHKVILSASSTFFRDLLANDHPQPLLLRGLKGSDLISVVDFIYHGEVEVEKDSLYDFLAIGEKLKLKGLAKTPEHSASQVDPAEDERSRYVQKIDSKNPYEATGIVKRPWDHQQARLIPVSIQSVPIAKPSGGEGQVRTTRHSYQSNGESMIDKNGNVWTCIVCGKIAADAKTKANLKRHTETHIKGIPWPCNICGKVSGSKSGLAQHKAKYHKDQESAMVAVKQQMDPSIPDDCMINSLIEKHGDVWVCTRCGKTAHDARTKANLKRHIEVHIEGVSYNCDICGKTSGSKNGLQQHKAKYHRNVTYTSQSTVVPIMSDPGQITHNTLS